MELIRTGSPPTSGSAAVRRDVRRKNCDDARDVDGKRTMVRNRTHSGTHVGSFLPLPAPAQCTHDINSECALDVIKYHVLYRTIRVRVLSLNRVLPV